MQIKQKLEEHGPELHTFCASRNTEGLWKVWNEAVTSAFDDFFKNTATKAQEHVCPTTKVLKYCGDVRLRSVPVFAPTSLGPDKDLQELQLAPTHSTQIALQKNLRRLQHLISLAKKHTSASSPQADPMQQLWLTVR
eukprot:9218141-Karenia_brevis.AAC.1